MDLVPEFPDNTIEFHYNEFSGDLKLTVLQYEFGSVSNKFKNGNYMFLLLRIKNGMLTNFKVITAKK